MSSIDILGGGNVEPRAPEDEMRSAYLDYALSVIVGRALPAARAGGALAPAARPPRRRQRRAARARGRDALGVPGLRDVRHRRARAARRARRPQARAPPRAVLDR